MIEHVRQCKFYGFARPGDQVEIEVEVARAEGASRKVYQGVGNVGGQRRVVAEFDGTIVPLEELERPEDQRALFHVLTRKLPGSVSQEGAIF